MCVCVCVGNNKFTFDMVIAGAAVSFRGYICASLPWL